MTKSSEKTLPNVIFVLGGAASGKSRYAESIVARFDRAPIYLATAQVFDAEMADKVAQHRLQRGPGWTTIEEPLDIAPALLDAPSDAVVLLDCATLWLTNVLLADQDTDEAAARLLQAIDAIACPIVIVSNEVGGGIVPENAHARRFRNAQGRLNQQLAAHADLVVQVIAGLPRTLKGELPQ